MKTTDNKQTFTYDYPKADNTVDAVVFGIIKKELHLLLIRRWEIPYKGRWALPGGYVEMNENLHDAVIRELREETGIELTWMEQLYTFGDPNRDPRGRVIATAYLALVNHIEPVAGDDAVDAKWFPLSKIPQMAFDHRDIFKMALQRLRSKLSWQPVGINFLPERFTMPELQEVYEIILGRKLDKRNFRNKIMRFGVLVPAGKKRSHGRPAIAYRFDTENYKSLVEQGIDFEVR